MYYQFRYPSHVPGSGQLPKIGRKFDPALMAFYIRIAVITKTGVPGKKQFFVIIDREAREIMYLVASACPSVRLTPLSWLNRLTYNLDICLWGFNMGKFKLSQISYPMVHSTLEDPGSISCGQYLDRTLDKFPPLYGPHLWT